MKFKSHLKSSDFLRVKQMSKWKSQNYTPSMDGFKPFTFHLTLSKQAKQKHSHPHILFLTLVQEVRC